jgi:hypothetical protein
MDRCPLVTRSRLCTATSFFVRHGTVTVPSSPSFLTPIRAKVAASEPTRAPLPSPAAPSQGTARRPTAAASTTSAAAWPSSPTRRCRETVPPLRGEPWPTGAVCGRSPTALCADSAGAGGAVDNNGALAVDNNGALAVDNNGALAVDTSTFG